MKKSVKWIIGAVIGVLLILSAVYSSIQPIAAELIEVQPGTVEQTVTEDAIVAAALERTLYASAGGKMISLTVKEGQRVAKGEVLAQLDTTDLELQTDALKAQRDSLEGQEKKAKAEIRNQENKTNTEVRNQAEQQKLAVEEARRLMQLGEKEYNRIRNLYDTGGTGKAQLDAAGQEMDKLRNTVSMQEQRLQQLQDQLLSNENDLTGPNNQYFDGLRRGIDAQIRQLEIKIKDGVVTAPWDGVITKLQAKEGDIVPPQTPILTVTGDGGLEVQAYLLAEDAVYLKQGMDVELLQDRRDRDARFKGTLASVAPSAVERVSALGLTERRIKVTIALNEPAGELHPGYALNAKFTLLTEKDKLAVPKTSIFPYQQGDAVWVVADGRAQIRQVKTGMSTDELVVIEEGLQPGERIVKDPQLEGLEQGKRVKEALK